MVGYHPTSRTRVTWLECEKGKDVLVFLLDKDAKWPAELKESYRSAAATEDGTATPGLIAEVTRNVAKLKEFRQWLEKGRIRATFTSPEDLKAKVIQALHAWLGKHPEFQPARPRR